MANSTPPDENRGPVVLAVTIAFLVVSSVFVLLRITSRAGVVRRVSLDDYFILSAWVIAFGFSFSICYGTSVGLGRHDTYLKPEWRASFRRCEYAFSVLYNPALMVTKTSILVFYLSLAKNQQIFRRATWATLFVVNVAGIALTILNIFQCRPLGTVFRYHLPQGANCTDIVTLYLSSAPVNIITDLAILILPIPVLTSIRLPRKEKIILVITFSFGAFVAVIDVVRIAYLQSAAVARLQNTRSSNSDSTPAEEYDFPWIAALSFMWSAVEVHVGIICACVPALKPLVVKILPSVLHDSRDHVASHLNLKSRFSDHSDHKVTNEPPLVSANPKPFTGPREDDSVGVDMMDFLTTPEMNSTVTQAQTFMTTPNHASDPSPNLLDFVSMNKPKSMVQMSNRESYFPIALVTILFFLWGFAYGLLSILNTHFQQIAGLSTKQSLGLHSIYYAAYIVGPLSFGRVVLQKWGFRAAFIIGLCIYGCGTLVFWPSAVLTSFPAFLISNFIVGLGVSMLEVAANPFITLCGPPEYAEIRLNLSQGFQAIGSVVSPLLANKVLFGKINRSSSLIDVQWTYLGIALFDVILAVAFYYFPIPEATDEELEQAARKNRDASEKKIGGVSILYVILGLGVFSQFCYVGGQEIVAGSIDNYIRLVNPNSALGYFNFELIGHTAFAIGRFLTALIGFFIKPRKLLMLLYIGMIITSALTMSLSGGAGTAMIILTQFFEAGVFSLIFAIPLRNLGARTKSGSAYMTAAIGGGAIGPLIQYPVIDSRGLSYSLCVVVAIYAFGSLFPIYLMLAPDAKNLVDPIHEKRDVGEEDARRTKSGRTHRASKGFIALVRRKRMSDDVAIEHVERKEGEEPGLCL